MALKGIGLNGKAEIHMRKLKMWLLGLAAAAMLSVSACAQEIPEGSLNGNGSVSAEENQAESADGDSQAVSSSENGGNRVSSASGTSFNLADVPAYSGQPYVAVNGNVPYFTDADLTDVSFESYSDLDSLGRCGVAYASVSQDTMPTEKRGSIGEVKPTGWHTAKYDNVDGKYLYNRCHLIGYQLTAENANVKNLITGTRYLNVQGMLPFENLTADYVKETGNHVMYRVTPVFEGNNLVASGVLMEAESVEDQGEGVLFCVYVYNVQPGIAIDYATGESGRTALEVREAQSDRERLEMAAARINRLDREQLVRREAALDPLEAARRFRPTFSIPTRKNFIFQAAHLSPR